MTQSNLAQLKRDAAYVRTKSHERSKDADGAGLDSADDKVLAVFSTPHTVTSAAKTLNEDETRIADAMQRLLQAERIQLSPDS
jgi:hypothetical protein